MEEITNVEVMTEAAGVEEIDQEIEMEETSKGSSKAFGWLVAGGIAAGAIGAFVAWKRHKNAKNVEESELEEGLEEDFYDEGFEDDVTDGMAIEAEVVEEKPGKK